MEQISESNPMLNSVENLKIIQMERKRYLYYFLLFLLVGISGIPFFYSNPFHRYLLVFLFLLSSILFLSNKNKFDKYFGVYLATFIILCILQSITIKYINFISFLGLIFEIVSAYFIVKIIGIKFIEYYVDIIVFLCIVSFIIFVPSLFFPQFQTFMIDKIAPLVRLPYDGPEMYKPFPYIILYTFNTSLTFQTGLPRNSGPFWEPGAFAGFIVVALIFNSIRVPNILNKRNLILIIALVSTFSTTGYIALFFFIASHNFLDKKKIEKLLLIPVLLVLFYMAFINLAFLNEKIENSIYYSNRGNINTLDRTRFVSAYLDIKQFLQYPIYGTGKWYNESIYKNFTDFQHRNNGITDFLVKFGLVGFLLYFFGVYKTFSVYNYLFGKNRLNAVFNLTLIFMIGFSEGFFQYMFFISLAFLHLIIKYNRNTYFFNKILLGSRDEIIQNNESKLRSYSKEAL